MASMGVRGREQPSFLHHTPFKPCPQPAVFFELGLCCPPTLHHAGSSLGWRRASSSPGGSICSYACIKFCRQELLGGSAPLPKPVSAKGLQLVAGASQGFSLSLEALGPVKGSCRPLWQLCTLFYVPWAELLPTHSPCFPPGTVVELDAALWYGGETQYFTADFAVQPGWC